MDNKELLRIMKVAHENGETITLKELYNYVESINAKEIIEWYEYKDIEEWSNNEHDFILDFKGFRGNIKENLNEVKSYISSYYEDEPKDFFEEELFEEGFSILYSENNSFGVDFEVTGTTLDNKTIYLNCVKGIA